jgi:hypothetical protein
MNSAIDAGKSVQRVTWNCTVAPLRRGIGRRGRLEDARHGPRFRNAVGADKDLRLAVERAGAELPGRPVGALLFTCNGRGRRMFGIAEASIRQRRGGRRRP